MKICFVGDLDSVHVQRWAKYFVDREKVEEIGVYKGIGK